MALNIIQQWVDGSYHITRAYADTEADLASVALDLDQYVGALITVMNSSGLGPRLFTVTNDVTPALIPLGNPPTLTVETTTTDTKSVSTSGSVLGDDIGGTLAVATRFPGSDAGSPFSTLWAYDTGRLQGVPAGRARVALTCQLSNVADAAWTVFLQRMPAGGSFSDYVTLYRGGSSGLFTGVPGQTVSLFTETLIPAVTDTYRIRIAHDQGTAQSMTINSALLIWNSVGTV